MRIVDGNLLVVNVVGSAHCDLHDVDDVVETTLFHMLLDLDGSIVDLDAILLDDVANVVDEIADVVLKV